MPNENENSESVESAGSSPSEKESAVTVSGIKEFSELDEYSEGIMTIVLRNSNYAADVHVAELWRTQFGLKVGIKSKPEYSDVFNELDWEKAHHKWSTERTEDTDMWEVDFDALLYVLFYFLKNDIDVTIEEEIREEYLRREEGVPLDVDSD